MIAGCVETTFRKLSGADFLGSTENSPITSDMADLIVRDWSNVFRYVQNPKKFRIVRNNRDLLKSSLGPVAIQRMEQIRAGVQNKDSIALAKLFDASKCMFPNQPCIISYS